jgi:DNA-binding NarL/FixJ family response regulator
MIRVVIADDQNLVRAGFRLLLDLEPDIEVVGEARGGREAVDLATTARPDVILMDIRMPVLDGIQATQLISSAHLDCRVLILTTFDLDEYVYEAMRVGASGFLLKDVGHELLLAGVRTAATGQGLISPTIMRRLVERFARPASLTQSSRLNTLTDRELDVLRHLARGRSNSEIAAGLWISEHTVKSHVAHLLAKLGLRDRVQAVVLAYEAGLINPGDDTSGGR